MAKSGKLLSVLVLLALSACGEESETDKSCEKARQMYKDMKDSVENPDSDGDGTVSVSEQAVFDGTKEILLDNLDDFVAGWYEMDGCDLDSGADSTSATTPATTESKRIVNGFTIEPGADLSGAHLTSANLRKVNLSGANLFRADLFRADLFRADLSGADLSGADLRHANGSEMNLSGADLIGADLIGANLTGANLTNANLLGANLRVATLTGANLTGANLSGATMPDGTKNP